jgi:dihydroflavonol-4-reductase
MPRVLITGANGHIGSNLIRDLLAHDYDVVPMVRAGADLRGHHGLDLEYRVGDILDADAVRAAVDGVEAVFHLAQPYNVETTDMDELVRPGVEGTKNVFAAMNDAGIKRVVYTSSVAACGMTDDPARPVTEKDFRESSEVPYSQAKILGERKATELSKEHGMDMVVTLPVGCVGRWDFKPTPTQPPVWDAANGKGPVAFAVNFTDIRDVAAAHRLALEKGTPGERYIVGSDLLLPDEIADAVLELVGTRPATSMPPRFVVSIAISVLGLFGKAPLTHAILNDLYGNHFAYDSSKARTQLGYDPRPPREAIAECLRWGVLLDKLKPGPRERMLASHPLEPEWEAALAATSA